MQPLSYYQENLCKVFLMVHSSDAVALALADNYTVQLDIRRGDEWTNQYIMPTIGEGIWVDSAPPYDQEWEEWSDPNFNGGRFPEDNHWQMEEYLIATDMTQLLEDPTVDEVRVRITDHRGNWIRTENVLPEGGEKDGGKPTLYEFYVDGIYSVLDVMFRDDNMYPDEVCYHYHGPEDRRVECDGYVAPRPAGECPLDVCAIVSDWQPDDYIEVTVSAPNDEPKYDSLRVLLYRLDYAQCPSVWDSIWQDYICASENYDDCVEIYCRYKEGRAFVNCPEHPLMTTATDSAETTENQPVDYSEPPCLFASSRDGLVSAPGEDFQDWASAMASHSDGTQNDVVWEHAEMIYLATYGQGKRGFLEPEYAIGTERFNPRCSGLDEYYDNYKRNLLNFGFEWVFASVDGSTAQYPIQSQADIMFVLSHGEVVGRPACGGYPGNTHPVVPGRMGQSYLYFFPDDPLPPFNEVANGGDVVFWEYWKTYLSADSDADWLALMACLMLGDTTTCAQSDAWVQWQLLVRDTTLRSVVGYRDFHSSDRTDIPWGSSPVHPNLTSTAFEWILWDDFCRYLEEGDHQPHPIRWVNGDVADEYGAMCYMEAAWEYYYYYELICGPWPDDWEFADTKRIRDAAAVDENHRYILEPQADPTLPQSRWPMMIHKL